LPETCDEGLQSEWEISMGDTRKDPEQDEPQPGEAPRHHRRNLHWAWPLGLALAALGSAATFMLRGCWHTHMGWPIRYDDEFSYQVCMGCGIKRLFDQNSFHAYGPYGYDVHELIARERLARLGRLRRHEQQTAARELAGKNK
jgi:hypothetical protein